MFTKLWKDKYELDWCHHCDTAIIVCPDCKNSSCNGGGCESCLQDFITFCKLKKCPSFFLAEEEKRTAKKIDCLRRYILTCLENDKDPIDFKWLKEEGHISPAAEDLFKS